MSFFFARIRKKRNGKPFLSKTTQQETKLLLITVNGHHHHSSKIGNAKSSNEKQNVHKNLLSCRRSCKCTCIENITSSFIFHYTATC